MAGLNSKKIFLWFGLYLCLVLLSVEILARAVLAFAPLHGMIRGHFDKDAVSRRLDWVSRHRDESLAFDFDIYHPTRGWALKPGISDKQVFGDKILNSNSRGIRGKTEYAYEKPEGVRRILVLGDSFTFGDEVSDEETYVARLENLLPSAEVINFGIHAYGHDQMLIYFREEGVKYNPDLVILGFLYDDMYRNLMEFRDFAKPKFDWGEGQLRLTRPLVPSPSSVLAWEWAKPKIVDLLRMLYERWGWRTGFLEKKMKDLSIAILDRLVHEIRETGAEPIMVYLCNEHDFQHYFDRHSEREQWFFDYCEGRGLDCTSVRPAFLKHIKAGEIMDTYGHWDARGHEVAAEAIRDYLRDYDKQKESSRAPITDRGPGTAMIGEIP